MEDKMTRMFLSSVAAAVLATFTIGTSALAASGTPNHPPTPIDDTQLQVLEMQFGGTSPLSTTRTIPHWSHSTLNPHDGVTYGFNMVGADPFSCSGVTCDFTIEVDIVPLIVNIDGMTFSGMDVISALLNSPIFATNDYSSTPYVSAGTPPFFTRAPGGPLSLADAGQFLQLLDAQMRAQFNKTGASNYHFRLHPNVLPPELIDVPNNLGILFLSRRGLVFGGADMQWWGAQIENLLTKADPTHLTLYLTDDVFTYAKGLRGVIFCCTLGYHAVKSTVGRNISGAAGSQGNPTLHTFAVAAWLSPGVYISFHLQDVNTVAHEISEWANDPFATNLVEPWTLLPALPGNVCFSNFLEVGDPVDTSGYAMGTNTFRQGPSPDGSQHADGYYHPQDEAFVPWFMRLSPNLFSEPTQTPSQNVGRYSFMGDLSEFLKNQPASACIVTERTFIGR
jgi:hypothetical protein